ncbi:pescadillo homolog [Drosophila ficusphila]|uniref:pescadillo homolog n=1 Tax=Drosophila ficusphila TaxID=30025 RepID=UPI0007E71B80|nr:pescadillo homolog [Drosophila ficusphila]
MADVEEEEPPAEVIDEQNEGQEVDEDLEGEDKVEGADNDDENEAEGEEESEEEEKDLFELLGESEGEDEEERAMYKEYLEVVEQIDAQNQVIKDLRAMSTRLMCKKCKTYKDKQEYKQLRCCQEQEELHLRVLVNRTIQLQNFGSPRRYGDLEMELTEADESYFRTALQPSCSEVCCCYSDFDSDSDSESYGCCT